MSATPQQTAPRKEVDWGRRLLVWGVVAVGLVVLVLVGAAVIPRWWAQRVGDQVQGSMTMGILVGLFYGFLFTLVPLVAIRLALRLFESWRVRLGAVGVAILLAAPNLMTLGIVLGSGNAAHAGERILDVEGPGFRGATLVGALAAIGLLLWVWYQRSSRRRALERAHRAETPPSPPEEEP